MVFHDVLFQLFCPCYLFILLFSVLRCLTVLSGFSVVVYRILACCLACEVLSLLSCLCIFILMRFLALLQYLLSCPGCTVRAVFLLLSFPSSLVPAVWSKLFCPCCLLRALLYLLSCQSCLVRVVFFAVLSFLFCP
jgi:hypothetical protein